MKLTVDERLCWDRVCSGWLWCGMRVAICVLTMWLAGMMAAPAQAQAVSTTTVQGTVYLANGQPAGGTLVVSWPTFTTEAGQLVAAGKTTLTVGADGFVSVNLAPNQGATPAGEYYTAILYMSDGTVTTQYWVVPAAAQASLAQVQAKVMPAAQAVQAVTKTYVDQVVAQAIGSQLTANGGNLTGPLYLNGDPTQPLQAADKHYVDSSFSAALPLTGGAATGPLTATKLGAAYQVDQFPGADFGAKLQACVNAVDATYGGTCDARNFTGTLSMGSNLTISTANTTVELPCATIATASQVIVTAGTRNVALKGCALRGGSAADGSLGGTVFQYSGTGPMVQVGDPAYLTDTPGFHLDNVDINTTGATSAAAQGLAAYRTQEMDVESVYFLGNANQTAMTLDGTGNYSGGTFFDNAFNGFATAVNAIGHQVVNGAATDWLNASTFVRLHIVCPTSGGYPVAGTVGINLQQGDGNTFTGGDVEGCATALHLGPNAQNNTILGLRNENSTNQVVADAGSAYNNWITGGTMFTGKLTDNGTRNSFLDTFHRSFNGMTGDWYGSQQDATVTNHYRLGTGTGNERGLMNRFQTDYGYRWTTGLTDATAGEQFFQIRDELNNVDRVSVGQYLSAAANAVTNVVMNNGGCYSSNTAPTVSFAGGGGSGAAGTANMVSSSCSGGWTVGSVTVTNHGSGYTEQPAVTWDGGDQVSAPNAVAEISTAGSTNNQTVLNSAGTGAVVLNGSNNAGTGGVVFGSGGPSETTVATINNAGNAQFNGTLQVGGSSTFTGTTTVKNQSDAEIDSILQAGLTAAQKESLIYRDWNGASQWYMVKDQNNNWALNSATGNLDSFKAYQSTNSGDTYINAAKSSGVVRVNYENGSGTAFNIYGGGSANLYASFGAANAIKFPGLAAASGSNCLQIDNSGYISNTGSPCSSGGTGGSGTVGSGLAGQFAYYATDGTTLEGTTTIPVSAGGTGASTAAGALANLLPGVSADGSNGEAVTGNIAASSAVTKNSPQLDVRAYGAKIDGSTDIGPALNNAMAACNVNNGDSCKVLLPCGGPNGCYLANGSSLSNPNAKGIVLLLQGTLHMGSTLVLPDRVSLFADGGRAGAQFQYRGMNAMVWSAGVAGNMGTAVTAGSPATFTPTFTNGSISNFQVNSAITVAGLQTCSATATRTSATSQNTTYTMTNCTDSSGNAESTPRTPPGMLISVTGCSDPSFNVTNATVLKIDWPNDLETITLAGTAGSTTGCTVTGFDENTYETVWIDGVSGGTLTATFAHPHAASDLYGMVGVAYARAMYNQHSMHGISIGYNYGVGLWLDTVAQIDLDGVAVGAAGRMTSAPMECDGCWQGEFKDLALSTFPITPQRCTSNCNQPSYPYGLRCSQDAQRSNGIGCQFLPIQGGMILGGIKVDGGGRDSSQGVGPQIGPLIGTTFEQTTMGAVTVDPRHGMGGQVSVSMNYVELQDNFLGNSGYYVAGTDCCVSGYADLGDLPAFAMSSNSSSALVNQYWSGRYMANGILAQWNTGATDANPGSGSGVLNNGSTIVANLRGENAALSPNVVPSATLPVTNPITCATCSTVTGPDGAQSAMELQSDASGNQTQVTAGSKSVATYAGDWIIFGAHVKPGNGMGNAFPGSGHGGNALYGLYTTGTDTFVQGQVGGSMVVGGGLLNLGNDSWQPGIEIAKVAAGQSSAHTLNFYLYSPLSTGVPNLGEQFYDWFWMYVPGPNNPAYAGTTQQDVVRWAQELLHGYTPSNAPGGGGVLYMDPNHKLSWGTSTNLYKGPNNSVKTDQAFDAVNGYKCNGSYGVSGDFLQSTGSGCQWATSNGSVPQVPSWLLYYGDGSGGAYSCTTGTCTINVHGGGEVDYSSFSVSSGATVTHAGAYISQANVPFIIRVNGTCNIAGTVSVNGLAWTGANNAASSGGGGGGGTAAGSGGSSASFYGGANFTLGGAAGTAGGGTGGNGNSFTSSYSQLQLGLLNNGFSGLTAVGGSQGGAGGSGGPAGGAGGGVVALVCQTMNFTGTVDASGAAGGNATANNVGASGGGGGGIVIMRSPNWTANTGTINVSGGAGGSCGAFTGCGAGGKGGDGWSKVFAQ